MALLRLTSFNFYMSILWGLPVEINNVGGGAFNFINYLSVSVLFISIAIGWKSFKAYIQGAIPFVSLVFIYVINYFTTEYGNITWLLYQILFIAIAYTLYCYSRYNNSYTRFLPSGLVWLYILLIGFVIFCTYQILRQYEVSYYFAEFNDAFVHALDDFGVMKQRYGYLLGFLIEKGA